METYSYYSKDTMMKSARAISIQFILMFCSILSIANGFVVTSGCCAKSSFASPGRSGGHCQPQRRPQSLLLVLPPLGAKISRERRDQLGIGEDQDEYDLDVALEQNTDPFITKVIAGSLILAILAGLVFGVVIPATTDYGEGICNPLLSAGRC
jgi:hypothetical protein